MDGRCLDQIDVDIAEDSFALFSSSSSQDGLISSSTEEMSPSRGAAVPLGAPLMNFPLNTFLAQHGSFLTVDPGGGGLVDVDDLVMGGFEPVSDLPSQSCSSLADWSLPHETVSSHNSMVQQYNLQCGSCQILHCVIHSNGLGNCHSLHTCLELLQGSKTRSLRFMDVMDRATMLFCTHGSVLRMGSLRLWNNR